MRGLEWAGVALSIFVFSGAVLPLMMDVPDGILDEAERAQLRAFALPVYAFTVLVLLRRPDQLLIACVRNLPMLALVALPFLSVFWSLSPSISLRRAVALGFSMAFACMLAQRFSPRQQIVLFGGVLCATILLGFAAAAVMPDYGYMPEEPSMRGVYLNKNVMGWAACFTMVMGLAAVRDDLRGMRLFGWALVVTGWAGIILSTSMTSLLGAVAALALLPALGPVASAEGLNRLVLQLLLVIVALILLAALATTYVPLLEALGKDATLTGRVPLWAEVDAEIVKHPVLGYGYGAFWADASPAHWEIWERIGWDAPHAHNGFRETLLGLGLVGLALLAVVFLQAFRQGLALLGAAPREGWIWCLLVLGVTLALNLAECTILMQNDLTWIMASTAIFNLSFRYAALNQPLSDRLRIRLAAA